MEAAEATATPDMNGDASEDTTNPMQIAHTRKVSAQIWVTMSSNMVTRQQLIRREHHGRSWSSMLATSMAKTSSMS